MINMNKPERIVGCPPKMLKMANILSIFLLIWWIQFILFILLSGKAPVEIRILSAFTWLYGLAFLTLPTCNFWANYKMKSIVYFTDGKGKVIDKEEFYELLDGDENG